MSEIVILFTGYFRADYWEPFVPKAFTYCDSSDFDKVMPKIIARQNQMIKTLGKASRTTVIIDNDAALPINVPVIENLNLRIVFVDNVETLKSMSVGVPQRQVDLATMVSM